MSFISKWSIYCLFEKKTYYVWDIDKPTKCPNNINDAVNTTSIYHIFRVHGYKVVTTLDSPVYLTGYNFYRCDTLNGNIFINLTTNKKNNRYLIIQKLSSVNSVNINNQFTLTNNLETIKLYYNNGIWTSISLDSYEGETDNQLEPSVYNNTTDDSKVNFSIISTTRNPNNNDDISNNYFIGSQWINTDNNINFTLVNNEAGNAKWVNNNYEEITSNFLTILDTTSLNLDYNGLENGILYFKNNTIKTNNNLLFDESLVQIKIPINLNGNKITNVALPTNNNDVTTKKYVDMLVASQATLSAIGIWDIFYKLPSGTNGGTPVSEAWFPLVLNNIICPVDDTIVDHNDVRLLNNRIMFQPGRYKIYINASFHNTDSTSLRLNNLTDGKILKRSNSHRILNNTNDININLEYETDHLIACEIQYWVYNKQKDTGLGFPIGIPNEDEIFVSVNIRKIYSII